MAQPALLFVFSTQTIGTRLNLPTGSRHTARRELEAAQLPTSRLTEASGSRMRWGPIKDCFTGFWIPCQWGLTRERCMKHLPKWEFRKNGVTTASFTANY